MFSIVIIIDVVSRYNVILFKGFCSGLFSFLRTSGEPRLEFQTGSCTEAGLETPEDLWQASWAGVVGGVVGGNPRLEHYFFC